MAELQVWVCPCRSRSLIQNAWDPKWLECGICLVLGYLHTHTETSWGWDPHLNGEPLMFHRHLKHTAHGELDTALSVHLRSNRDPPHEVQCRIFCLGHTCWCKNVWQRTFWISGWGHAWRGQACQTGRHVGWEVSPYHPWPSQDLATGLHYRGVDFTGQTAQPLPDPSTVQVGQCCSVDLGPSRMDSPCSLLQGVGGSPSPVLPAGQGSPSKSLPAGCHGMSVT